MEDYSDENCGCDRMRRDTASNHYTEEDIRYYRKLMNGNIRRMREIMLKQKMAEKQKTTDRSPIKKVKHSFQRSSVPKREVSLKSALQQVRNKLGRTPRETVKNLKTELQQRLNNPSELSVDDIGGEMKELIHGIKNKLEKRMTRSAEEVYIPKVISKDVIPNFYVPLDMDKFFEESKKIDFGTKKPAPFDVIYGNVKEIPFVAKHNKEKRHVDRVLERNGVLNEIKAHEGNRVRTDLLVYDDEEYNNSIDNEVEEEQDFVRNGKKSKALDKIYDDVVVSSFEEERRRELESDIEQIEVIDHLPNLLNLFNEDHSEIVPNQKTTNVTPWDVNNATILVFGPIRLLNTAEETPSPSFGLNSHNKADTKTWFKEMENVSKQNKNPREETMNEQNRRLETKKIVEEGTDGVANEENLSKVKAFARRISEENAEERRKSADTLKGKYVVMEEVIIDKDSEVQMQEAGYRDEKGFVESTHEPSTIQNEVDSEEIDPITNSADAQDTSSILHYSNLADSTTEDVELIHEGKSVLDNIFTTLAGYVYNVWSTLRALI